MCAPFLNGRWSFIRPPFWLFVLRTYPDCCCCCWAGYLHLDPRKGIYPEGSNQCGVEIRTRYLKMERQTGFHLQSDAHEKSCPGCRITYRDMAIIEPSMTFNSRSVTNFTYARVYLHFCIARKTKIRSGVGLVQELPISATHHQTVTSGHLPHFDPMIAHDTPILQLLPHTNRNYALEWKNQQR